jgi:hypothetical protein
MKHSVTPDGRYFVVRGRLWRMANPSLDEAEAAGLLGRLIAARRAVRDAKQTTDREGESSLRHARCVEVYPGPADLLACFGDSLLAK